MDITEIQHESITAENRPAFATHMEKFDSMEAAAVDGMALKQLTGKPFKFPDSMDKLPDDAARNEFISGAHKLLGITHAKDIAELADVDLKQGMADGAAFDDNLANAFKQFAIDEKINIATLPKLAGFLNTQTGLAVKAMAEKKEADSLAKATAVNEALIADPEFGSKEKVAEKSELLRRAIKSHIGLSDKESEEFADLMADTLLTKSAPVAKAMLKILAPLAAESSTDGGSGTAAVKTEMSEQDKQVAIDCGWIEPDKK